MSLAIAVFIVVIVIWAAKTLDRNSMLGEEVSPFAVVLSRIILSILMVAAFLSIGG